MTIILGVLLGLSTLLFIGPVFFYLIKSALEDGFLAGVYVSLGVLVGDLICVLLVVYGFSDFFNDPIHQKWFAGIGGLMILGFGVNYLVNPTIKERSKQALSAKKGSAYFINGFLINFVNPFVFGVWFGFYSLSKAKLIDHTSVVICLSITLVVIFITDLLKAFFAQKLTPLLQPKMLKVVFRIIGVVMLGFGIRLMVAFFNF